MYEVCLHDSSVPTLPRWRSHYQLSVYIAFVVKIQLAISTHSQKSIYNAETENITRASDELEQNVFIT